MSEILKTILFPMLAACAVYILFLWIYYRILEHRQDRAFWKKVDQMIARRNREWDLGFMQALKEAIEKIYKEKHGRS